MRNTLLLFSLSTALGIGGCTALRPIVAPSARQCPWIEAQPSALEGPAHQEMRARITAPGVDHAFTLAVERRADSLIAIGLTPLGTKSFEIELRDRARVANHLGLVAVVPPRNVLADLTGIMIASPCATASAQEATAEHGRWTIRDACSNGRPTRRHVRGPGEVGNVDIRYEGDDITVLQHDCGYEAQYVRVGTAPLAAARLDDRTRDVVRAEAGRRAEPARSENGRVDPVPVEPARMEPARVVREPVVVRDRVPAPAPPPTAAAMRAASPLAVAPHVQSIIDDLDRTDADRALDAGRRPGELLTFLDVRPGMRVAELGAGAGYTAELLARAVGWNGAVYAQNSDVILKRFAEQPWSERLARPVMRKVVRVDREFSAPLPPEARNLDLVLNNLFYHDTVWMKADRDAMNRAIFRALAPGGRYVVIDHTAGAGRGVADAETLHRIEESVVREEIVRAGFRLQRESDFLRNPADTLDWNASPRAAGERRGESDRFVLEFVKPR